MQEYYFLFGLGLIWTIFAVVQDLRTREVSNWLNFSLIAFALAYRAFYAVDFGDWRFFILGVFGFFVFLILAHLFYYGKVFAGGDAKLMMGFGVILPYSNFNEFVFYSVLFLFSLFIFGAVWSLIYSIGIVFRNWKKFKKAFVKQIHRGRMILILAFATGLVFALVDRLWIYFSIILVILPFLYFYVKSLDVCMIRLANPSDLTEGDWLERDVKIRGKWIRKSVHGLNKKEIEMLKKVKKKVFVKDGVPFTPAFLLALFMVFYVLVSGFPFVFSLLL